MVVRFYSSVALQTTLSAGITSSSTTIQVGAVTGFPANTPYSLALDYQGVTEEIVQVNSTAGTTLTVDRGVDGTSAAAHNAGAIVRHVSSARDFSDSRTHENSSNGVHGLSPGEDLVGTLKVQSLSNKTLVNATGTLQNVNINNTSTFVTLMTGDVATPNNDAFAIRPNATLPPTLFLNNMGTIKMVNPATLDTNIGAYRLRITKSNGTTDVFSVLSGGSPVAWMSNGSAGYTLNASPDNVRRTAYLVNASDGATQRAAIYSDGSASFLTQQTGNSTMDVRASNGQTVPTFRVLDFTGFPAFTVDGGGNMSAANAGVINLNVSGTATLPLVSDLGSAVFNASTGWGAASAVGTRRAGITTVVIGMVRTGAVITPSSPSGNIAPDSQLGTLTTAYRPNGAINQSIIGSIGDGVSSGTCRINPDGTIDFIAWTAGVNIDPAGGSTYRFYFTFPSN